MDFTYFGTFPQCCSRLIRVTVVTVHRPNFIKIHQYLLKTCNVSKSQKWALPTTFTVLMRWSFTKINWQSKQGFEKAFWTLWHMSHAPLKCVFMYRYMPIGHLPAYIHPYLRRRKACSADHVITSLFLKGSCSLRIDSCQNFSQFSKLLLMVCSHPSKTTGLITIYYSPVVTTKIVNTLVGMNKTEYLGAIHNYQCFKISIFYRKCGWVGKR